jgi:hypothetical protein
LHRSVTRIYSSNPRRRAVHLPVSFLCMFSYLLLFDRVPNQSPEPTAVGAVSPLSRFTSRVGGGSASYVRHRGHVLWFELGFRMSHRFGASRFRLLLRLCCLGRLGRFRSCMFLIDRTRSHGQHTMGRLSDMFWSYFYCVMSLIAMPNKSPEPL